VRTSVESAIREGTGSCIYISGVPGTGKTATVHEVRRRAPCPRVGTAADGAVGAASRGAGGQVLRTLRAEVDAGDLVPFDFVELNGMRLTDPANAYSVLWEALTGKRLTPAHAALALEKHFSVPNPRCARAPARPLVARG